ncbi:MAG: hypothetical protein IPH16_04540 [Haliscomenobacter sp.]|nr:hypothetical protein [Haliscomenobacter sp.]MBK7474990.1 hypothetical protein [Haliscomenobacter sp.]MBK8880437.1 hypothetical protein [Haliscomenobacter sp.]
MRFDAIIGQEEVKARLRQMVTEGRMPHATLLLGPPGSGSLALALATASYLLCTGNKEADVCGACAHCLKSQKLIHPDLHFSFPVTGANVVSDHHLPAWRLALLENPYLDVNSWLQRIGAENKQGNLNKDECLSIIHKISLKPFESEQRVLVLWMPEFLGKEGNRLLKLIEEPPAQTYFILVAENAELILPTLLSRCQLVKIPPLPDQDVVRGLAHRFPEVSDQAPAIAYLANGNFNEALLIAQRKDNPEANAFLDWMRKAYQGNGQELVRWAEQAASWGRENQKHFLQFSLYFLRELLALKIGGGLAVRLQQSELEAAQRLASLLEVEMMEQLSRLWSDNMLGVERNAHPKILFLDASIQMHHIMRQGPR